MKKKRIDSSISRYREYLINFPQIEIQICQNLPLIFEGKKGFK